MSAIIVSVLALSYFDWPADLLASGYMTVCARIIAILFLHPHVLVLPTCAQVLYDAGYVLLRPMTLEVGVSCT